MLKKMSVTTEVTCRTSSCKAEWHLSQSLLPQQLSGSFEITHGSIQGVGKVILGLGPFPQAILRYIESAASTQLDTSLGQQMIYCKFDEIELANLVVRLSRCQLHYQILEVALEFHPQSICEILAAKSQMLFILERLHGPTYEPTCWKGSEGNCKVTCC